MIEHESHLDEIIARELDYRAKMDKLIAEETNYRNRIVEEALKYEGNVRIVHTGPEEGITPEMGFDCSGFVYYILQSAGIPIPSYIVQTTDGHTIRRKIRHANEFYDRFGVHVDSSLAQSGDLVFFSWEGVRPNHMGIMIDPNHYIHAHRHTNLVQVDELIPEDITSTRSDRLYVRNPIGFKRPAVVERKGAHLVQRPI